MLELDFEEEITKPMTNNEYHAHPALGSTNLKEILKNPYKYKMGVKKEQTPAMVMGSAIHCMVLEPHLFDEDYAIAPIYDGRTKEGKAIKEQFEHLSGGKTVLKNDDYVIARSCADAIISSDAKCFFQNGIAEKEFFGEIDGIEVKCKPDYFIEELGIVVDIKKTVDASKDGFAKACANFGYHISAAHYIDTLRSIGKRVDKFVLVCVEPEFPFMVAVYEFCEADLDLGREKVKQAIEIYKRIDEFDKPMYRDKEDTKQLVQTIVLPAYAHYQNI